MRIKVGDERFEAVGILTLENKNATLINPQQARASHIPFKPENLSRIQQANANDKVLGIVRQGGNVKYMVDDPSYLQART